MELGHRVRERVQVVREQLPQGVKSAQVAMQGRVDGVQGLSERRNGIGQACRGEAAMWRRRCVSSGREKESGCRNVRSTSAGKSGPLRNRPEVGGVWWSAAAGASESSGRCVLAAAHRCSWTRPAPAWWGDSGGCSDVQGRYLCGRKRAVRYMPARSQQAATSGIDSWRIITLRA